MAKFACTSSLRLHVQCSYNSAKSTQHHWQLNLFVLKNITITLLLMFVLAVDVDNQHGKCSLYAQCQAVSSRRDETTPRALSASPDLPGRGGAFGIPCGM